MDTKKENILTFLVLAAIIVAMFIALFVGVGKSEKLECLKWQKEAEEYPDFFLTEWQKKQCEHHKVEIKL